MNRPTLQAKLTALQTRITDSRTRLQAAVESGADTRPYREAITLLEVDHKAVQNQIHALDAAETQDREARVRERATALTAEARAGIDTTMTRFDIRRFTS